MDDEANVVVDAHGPEIRVARSFEPVGSQTGARQVQLEIKRRRLYRPLLHPSEPGEAGGEGIGDAEVQRSVSLKRQSQPRLTTLIGIRSHEAPGR